MTIAKQIQKKCSRTYTQTGGVLPPPVCPYCMGCPVGAIVAGINGEPQRGPLDVPPESVDKVKAWAAR